jgi:DNA-binding NtrC family response regulator
MAARILVVEDDDETREAVAGALRDLGYDASVCPDARTARAHSDVDLVVTDIRMPGESGLELCADIAGNRPDLPVILMTAFGDTRAVSLGLRAGASDFLAKPFSLSDLGEAVGRALERRRRSAPVLRLADSATGSGKPLPGVVGSTQCDSSRTVFGCSPTIAPLCSSRARPELERNSSRAPFMP